MKQLPSLLILFLLLSCATDKKVEPESEDIILVAQRDYLQTFDWSSYYFKKGNLKVNPDSVQFDLIGNVEFRTDDTTLWIMPLDTAKIIIEIQREDNKKRYGLKAKPNHLIDSSWYHVPLGEFPTPLDDNSFKAWANFSQFQFLHRQVPKFEHYDYLTSETITPDIFGGKTTLLNFWYRGCMPCMAEMPALKKLKEEWKYEEDVQFISVCLDSIFIRNDSVFVLSDKIHSTAPIPDYTVETGFRHIGSGSAIADTFWVRAYPTNLIIDQNGIARKVMVGANPDNSNDNLAENLSKEINRIQQAERLNQELQEIIEVIQEPN